MAEDKDIFSFVDDSGQTIITDTLEEIPKEYQKVAKKISIDDAKKMISDLEKKVEVAKKKGLVEAKHVQREVGDVAPFVNDIDLPSFAMGFAGALSVVLILAMARRTGRILLKVGMFVLIAALISGAYFAWLRRAAGLGDTKLASPQAMIEDARDAAKAMEKRLKDQQRMLERIERTSR